MRFKTIWTMPASTIRERLRRTRDWAAQAVAARLPLRIRYWTTLQEVGRATMSSPNVPATPLAEIITKLDAPRNLS